MSGEHTMLARTGLDAQEALVCTMVLVAAADGAITDREIGVMSGLVQTLPAFQDFSRDRLEVASEAAISLLEEDEGLAHAGKMIREALEPRLREIVMAELRLEPLVAAAIERAARARHQRIDRAA